MFIREVGVPRSTRTEQSRETSTRNTHSSTATPFWNECSCRQTDADTQGRHLGRPSGGNISSSPRAFVTTQLRLLSLPREVPSSLLREFLIHHCKAFWETPDPSPWAPPPADRPGVTGGTGK
uniref:Uncharacterized protein n=1 Tax=Knipowitschia caucasica TaxID=637954 RepID=A0AAV2K999_KNICA